MRLGRLLKEIVTFTHTRHIVEAKNKNGEWVEFCIGFGEDEREWALDCLRYLQEQGIPCRYVEKSEDEYERDKELRAREDRIQYLGMKLARPPSEPDGRANR